MGINTRTSSADPEEISDTLKHTQDWMLANNAIGRRIGWVVFTGEPDFDEDAGIADWAVMGVVNSMAVYLAPYFEKPINPAWQTNAMIGMSTITARTVEIQPVQYPSGFPRGQANTPPWGPHHYEPENRVVTGGDYLSDEGDDPVVTP